MRNKKKYGVFLLTPGNYRFEIIKLVAGVHTHPYVVVVRMQQRLN